MTTNDTGQPASDASTAELVSRLGEQVSTLIRSELRLAQVELQEKGKRAGIGVGVCSAGLALARSSGRVRWWRARSWRWSARSQVQRAAPPRRPSRASSKTSNREGATSLMTEPRTPADVDTTTERSRRAARGDRTDQGAARRHRRGTRQQAGRQGAGQGRCRRCQGQGRYHAVVPRSRRRSIEQSSCATLRPARIARARR